MAIVFGTAVDSSQNDFAASSTFAVDIPSHSSGDLLAIVICTTTATSPATAINTPSGWTKGLDIEAGSGSAVRLTLFLKDGNGSETTVDITLSGDPDFTAGATCLVLTGAETASSAIDVSDTVTLESTIDITSPDVTAGEADVLVLYGFCFDSGLAVSEDDVDSDAGFSGTMRGYNEQTGGVFSNGFAEAASTKTQGSGSTGTCVWSTLSRDGGCAFTAVLKSVAGGINIAVPLKTFTFAGLLPTIETGVEIAVPLKPFSFTGLIPAVGTSAVVDFPLKAFNFTGFDPTVETGVNVDLPLKTFNFTGFLPSVSAAEGDGPAGWSMRRRRRTSPHA